MEPEGSLTCFRKWEKKREVWRNKIIRETETELESLGERDRDRDKRQR